MFDPVPVWIAQNFSWTRTPWIIIIKTVKQLGEKSGLMTYGYEFLMLLLFVTYHMRRKN